jgi:AraC-like DNA-binding protein
LTIRLDDGKSPQGGDGTPRASVAGVLANSVRRFPLDASLLAWSCTFPRTSFSVPWLSLGVEIAVVLAGEREIARRDVSRTCREGTILTIDFGERYTTRYVGRGEDGGREIGFVLRADRDPALREAGSAIEFAGETADDPAFVELAAEVARSLDRDGELPRIDFRREVDAFVRRHGRVVRLDDLARARLELHAHFDKPLYMRHFAEIAGVHEATFGRKFAARFGVTPARYRTLLRLQEAAVLLATKPELTVADAAARVGFEDVPYFHRAFAARIGSTPLRVVKSFGAGLELPGAQ